MSKIERAGPLIIGIIGLVLMAVQVWDVLDRRGAMGIALSVCVWVLSLLMVAYSVYKNLHDASRAESLQAQIQTIKDEHKTQAEALSVRHTNAVQKAVNDTNLEGAQRVADAEVIWRQTNAEVVGKLQKELAELRGRVPEPFEDPTKDMDLHTYHLIRDAFVQLPWPQKVALKWIRQEPKLLVDHLRTLCENSGFADPEDAIIRPLLANRVILDGNETAVWLKSSDVRKMLDKLYREFPLY